MASFEADVKSSWGAFSGASANPGDAAKMDGEVDTNGLKTTIEASKWKKKYDDTGYENIMKKYNIEMEEYSEAAGLDLQEFVYMNIMENIDDDIEESECSNCFMDTKKIISDFFDYIDCDENNFILAENMYMGLKNIGPL